MIIENFKHTLFEVCYFRLLASLSAASLAALMVGHRDVGINHKAVQQARVPIGSIVHKEDGWFELYSNKDTKGGGGMA